MSKIAILLFTVLLLSISSVSYLKVTAQSNDSSSEKSTTTAKTCSPELFKEKPGLCAAMYALAHNKESSASAEKPAAEKPVENLNLLNSHSPIGVKKLPTMEENNAKAPPTGVLTGALEIKKPSVNQAHKIGISQPNIKGISIHCAEGWFQAKMKSGELVCLTSHATGAVKPVAERPLVPCKGPAGTNNGIASLYTGRQEVNGKCEVSLGHVKPMG
jgi:hypothetical protein